MNLVARSLRKVKSLLPLARSREAAPEATSGTPVDAYWTSHTVNSRPFKSVRESEDYLEWRFSQYPLFRSFMDLWGAHDGEVLLDYGCGPGNDLAGFLLYTAARRVIGVDVSKTALELAKQRLDLHKIPAERYALIRVSDARPVLPIADASIDYVYCEGVLHHTSHPETILREFWRVLKPGGRACIMVYNRNSVWLHLYTAYDRMILKGDFRDMSLDQAFARNTDGEACPISRCYSPEEWKAICAGAGFDVEYVGGYLSLHELDLLGRLGKRAIGDPRLEDVHRSFLASLEYDDHGYPMSAGKHAGIGGVYRLLKRRPNEAPSAAAR